MTIFDFFIKLFFVFVLREEDQIIDVLANYLKVIRILIEAFKAYLAYKKEKQKNSKKR